jgi:general secretion pathway protein A
MYLAFYGLDEKPFNTTPDPKFLYLTPSHREALAQLTYAVQEGKGFLTLTGEIGTGKTTLLRTVLQRLGPGTAAAFVGNSRLSFDGLLEYVLEDLGVPVAGTSPAQRLVALNRFLIERRRAGQRTVIIIDEAQNLDVPTLEEIRLLSNFESPEAKLLQILLVGQPELEAKLGLPELRQLEQRLELRCRIRRLTVTETRDYIRARLRVANARDLALFSDRAVARIATAARGVPRRVNILCDHCLVIGYADQKRRIEPDVVEQAVASANGAPKRHERATDRHGRGRRVRLRWLLGALAAAIGAGVTILPFRPEAEQLLSLLRTAGGLLVR